jgi:undecaprenyl-diphosphatase
MNYKRLRWPLAALFFLILAAPLAAGQTQPQTQPANQKQNQKQPGDHITLFQSAVLGLVEGLTEYLPVSSTGHLILTSHYMDLSESSAESGPMGPKIIKNKAIDAYEVIIQLGAILAVLGLYRKRVRQMVCGLLGRDPVGLRLFSLLMLAFAPAAILGLIFHKPIQENLFSPYTVAGALIVGGVLMIVVEWIFWRPRKIKQTSSHIDQIRYWQALVIGLAQCLAMWPGTSRSMITILAAIVVGLNFVTAAEFSFLLALPTLGGATIYAASKDWGNLMDAAGPDTILIGVVVSGLAAAVAVKAFVKWLTHHGMIPFGIYRILLGLAVFAYFLRNR